MILYNRFLLTLTLFFAATTVGLAFAADASLDLYVSLYLIEFLLLSLFFMYINPRAQRVLSTLGIVLLPWFFLVAAYEGLRAIALRASAGQLEALKAFFQ